MKTEKCKLQIGAVFRLRVALAATPLACWAGLAFAAGLPGPTIPDGLGVNIHFTDPRPGEMEMLAAAGFRWVRMDFSWSATERDKDRYNFSAYDRLLAALDEHQIRAIFILDYSNRHYDGGPSPSSDEGRRAMARWAAGRGQAFPRTRRTVGDVQRAKHPISGGRSPMWTTMRGWRLEVGRALAAAEPEEVYAGPATPTIDFKFLEKCFQAGSVEILVGCDGPSVSPGQP